jgi:hypothetical protein
MAFFRRIFRLNTDGKFVSCNLLCVKEMLAGMQQGRAMAQASHPPRKLGFNTVSVRVGFVVDQVVVGQVSPREHLYYFYSTFIPQLGQMIKLIIFLVSICITGLHDNPQGCGASAASPAGPFSTIKRIQ